MLLIGDFNYRCKTWNSRPYIESKRLRNQLVEFSDLNNLAQLTDEPIRGQSILDLIFTNIPTFVLNYGVCSPPDLDLDHSLIFIELDYIYPKPSKVSRKIWLYDQAEFNSLNWELNE